MSKGRRRAWLGALGVAALMLGAWWWLRSGAAASGGSDVAAAAPPEPAAPVLPPVEAPPEALPEPIRRFLEATPYPPTSGRLTSAHEDLLSPNARYERHRAIPDTLGDPAGPVTWLFTADRWAYVGPVPVRAWLEVRRGGQPVDARIVAASAVREGADGDVGRPEPLRFERDAGRFVTQLDLARLADHSGPIALRVRFEYEPGRFHEDLLRIFSTPEGRVPGRIVEMSDRVSNGNLVLDLGVDLGVSGFYRFDANVFDAAGNPVAFVVWKGDLAAGSHQVPLEVWGKVLRDAGVPGPYTVEQIRGYHFIDGGYPDRELLPDAAGTHVTAPWPLQLFSDAAHVGADEERMVELMLDDLAQGRGLFVPPAAADAVAPRPPDDDAEPALP
jgi:hypothetical protein